MAAADRAAEVFSAISQPRGQRLVALAKNDPALAKRIDDAVRSFDETGSQRDLLRLLSETTGMTDPRSIRMPNEPYAMPSKPSTADVERRLVEQELGPAFASGSPQAVRSALDEIIAAGGGDELIRRLGKQSFRASTPEYSLDIFNNPSILSQANTDILPPTASAMDVNVGAALPSTPSTALIPAGPRGLAVAGERGLIVPPGRGLSTTGGPRDLSVQGMESPAPRGLPAPNQPRLEGPVQRRIEGPAPRGRDLPPPRRQAIDDPEVPPRNPRGEPDAPRRRQVDPRLVAAGIGAGAAGLHLINEHLTGGRPVGGSAVAEPSLTTADLAAAGRSRPAAGRTAAGGRPVGGSAVAEPSLTTADLAAESAPPPRVPVASGELTPREQAHELIAKLNLMRRNAGGEVPEAPAMQREINRLLAMSNQTMAAASRGEVAMAGNDPHAQATRLLAQLNQMRREAGGEVPQAQQIMAEVARLNRLGDAQRNARTTAFPRRAG